MGWREVSVLDERREFVRLALQEGANRRELCRRFGVSARAGYKWLDRWRAGDETLADRSRRPHASPQRSSPAIEAKVLEVRQAHPAWGARKIEGVLARAGVETPAISTVHEILRRHDQIDPKSPSANRATERFEMPAPNRLWQMDYKGWGTLRGGERCHPLTIVDDHSRFSPCLKACADQKSKTVQGHLETTFARYGLPDAIFVDNGSPWSDAGGERWTMLSVWLLKLGVEVWRSRPYHPQSRGKNERFHRTLKAEVFAMNRFSTFEEVQRAFDQWRDVYNYERPHEALDQKPPSSRYRTSARRMPGQLPAVSYEPGEIVRKVSSTKAYVSFKGRLWKVPQAFRGEQLAIRQIKRDGGYGAFFGSQKVADIDLNSSEGVTHVPEQVSPMPPG